MPTSEARVNANRQNAAKSTGPKTDEGKARSRGNALKHGLTGEGVVLPVEDSAKVAELERSFRSDLKPSGDVGRTLVRRLAVLAVRMDRCVEQETASLTVHILQAQADFDAEWPDVEGVEDPAREEARAVASKLAMFDPSKPACLARKYEAAAERGFFRALKELRLVERQAQAAEVGPKAIPAAPSLGSFSPAEATRPVAAQPAPKVAPSPPRIVEPAPISRPKLAPAFPSDLGTALLGSFDVPFTIGRVG